MTHSYSQSANRLAGTRKILKKDLPSVSLIIETISIDHNDLTKNVSLVKLDQ